MSEFFNSPVFPATVIVLVMAFCAWILQNPDSEEK